MLLLVGKKLGPIAVFVCVFMLMGLANNLAVEKLTGYAPQKGGYGWNLYVGGSPTGAWNPTDGNEFSLVFDAAVKTDDIQSYFAPKGWERIKNMGPGLIYHAGKKLVLGFFSARYIAGEAMMLEEGASTLGTYKAYLWIASALDYPIMVLAVLSILWSLWSALRRRVWAVFPLALFATGCAMLLSVLEMASRYTVMFRLFFPILAAWGICELISLLKAKKNTSKPITL